MRVTRRGLRPGSRIWGTTTKLPILLREIPGRAWRTLRWARPVRARGRESEIAAVAQPQEAAARLHLPQADIVEVRVELELAEFDAGHVLLRHMVIHADEGVIARIAGARGDPGTGVGAMPLTGGSLARRPEARRVTSDPDADVRFDAIHHEVEFHGEVHSSRTDVCSESSVLE